MKKLFVAMLLTVVTVPLFTSSAQAQYSNSIGADPISLAFGRLAVTYEHRVSTSNSFSIFGSYWSFIDWAAYGIGGSYRWYLDVGNDKQALEGLSVGPLIGFASWSWSGDAAFLNTSYSGGISIIICGSAAYKWVFGGFVVEPNATISFNAVQPTGLSGYNAFGLGVNLGYAWK
ncbi:MAG TPA: hypothetical protein VFJ29_01575 [Candidatus Kapabacteria bacterium]|nr:hypothetical protein [Candidatus Kapabacteria bacterium]